MDALKNNKFLSTYLITLAVGSLALGYFVWSGRSASADAESEYSSVRREIDELEGKSLYPSKDNVTKAKEAVDTFKTKVDELQKGLASYHQELDNNLDGSEFKARLTKALADVKSLAEASNVKIEGSEFDLGFGAYKDNTPIREAVADLNFSLQSIQALTETIIKSHATSLGIIRRIPLAVETAKPTEREDDSKAKKPASSAKKPAAAGPAPLIAEDEVIKRYPFVVTFTGPLKSIEEVINEVANTAASTNLYALRFTRIENAKKLGSSKSSIDFGRDDDGGGDEEDKDKAAAKAKKKRDCAVILGAENVTARLYIDGIRVLEPAKPATPESKSKPEAKTAAR